MLTDEQIKEYQVLYRKRFGKDISREEAYAEGMKLILLFKLVSTTLNGQRRQEEKTLNNETIS